MPPRCLHEQLVRHGQLAAIGLVDERVHRVDVAVVGEVCGLSPPDVVLVAELRPAKAAQKPLMTGKVLLTGALIVCRVLRMGRVAESHKSRAIPLVRLSEVPRMNAMKRRTGALVVSVAALAAFAIPAAEATTSVSGKTSGPSAEMAAVVPSPEFAALDLGTLGGTTSAASATSPTGQVVGAADTSDGSSTDAFSWTQTGVMVDLGTLGGTWGYANAVSPSGQVVGNSYTAGGERHPFSWTQGGGIVDLGTLGGSQAAAIAVNASGQVVGYSTGPGDSSSSAFSWTQAGGRVGLGARTAEDEDTPGQVVGARDEPIPRVEVLAEPIGTAQHTLRLPRVAPEVRLGSALVERRELGGLAGQVKDAPTSRARERRGL